MITEITDAIWIGDSVEDAMRWASAGGPVLAVTDTRPSVAVHNPRVAWIPICDADGNVLTAQVGAATCPLHVVDEGRQNGERLLVVCETGDELAPIVAANFLMRSQGLDRDQAFDLIQAKRPGVVDWRGRWPAPPEAQQ